MKHISNIWSFLVVLTITSTALTSCQQTDVLPTDSKPATQTDVQLVEGTLHFKNAEAFKNTMTLLHKNGASQLDAFENNLHFTNSLRRKMIASQEEENSEIVPSINVKDLYLAAVVNDKGVFYIGNTLHKITDKYEYALPNGNEQLLAELLTNSTSARTAGLIRHTITGFNHKSSDKNARFSGMETQYEGLGTDEGGSEKRVGLEAWSRNYLLYASNGVNLFTQSYRKTCRLCSRKWRESAVAYLKVSVESRQYSSITNYGYWFVLNKEEEAYNYDHIQKVMDYVAGTGVWIDTEYIKCTYSWIGGDNVRPVNYTQVDRIIEWRN